MDWSPHSKKYWKVYIDWSISSDCFKFLKVVISHNFILSSVIVWELQFEHLLFYLRWIYCYKAVYSTTNWLNRFRSIRGSHCVKESIWERLYGLMCHLLVYNVSVWISQTCLKCAFVVNHSDISAYKLNKQGDNKQPWRTPFPIWKQSIVPCPVLTVALWPANRFLKRQVRWSGTPISFRIFHSLLWSTQSKVLA